MSAADGISAEHGRVGGMALANGLLVHGPSSWAVAVQRDDGSVSVTSGRKPRLSVKGVGSLPVLRGTLRLVEAIAVIPTARAQSPDARLAMEDPLVGITMGVTTLLAAVAKRRLRSTTAQEFVGAFAGIVPSVALLSRSRAATWHAVEHKSIAAYEDRGPAGVAHSADYAKEHERCGSNLVVPLMVLTAVGNVIARRSRFAGTRVARAGVMAFASGAAVELFAYAARNPGQPVSRAIHRVGHTIQARFVTREPATDELAVGRAAMTELLRREATRDGRS
ncbi:MAG: DUF1385 domain-containing protein [Actinobacteria bacterium]|nr:DUF1385 domain-containing protein [Actinomycetota bacterium]